MAATIKVGIIGMGRIGASIGLALKRYNTRRDSKQQFQITGYPSENLQSQSLKKIDSAADHLARNINAAASDKDIVVLALPYRDVQATYQLIGRDLRSGSVLLDTSALKLPSQQWAEKYLGDEAHMVGVLPVLNAKYLFDGLDDTEHAAVDLFDGGSLVLLPNSKTDRAAVELASDFGELIGMTPLFGDPVEHDVWATATESLPAALAIAAFYTIFRRDGWNDVRKIGNPNFGRMTHQLFDQNPDDVRDLLLNNRDNTIRQIDATVETLQALRDLLAANDQPALEEMLIQSMDAYVTWIVHRREGKWDRPEAPASPTKSDLFMNGMFGSYLTKRMRGERPSNNGDEE